MPRREDYCLRPLVESDLEKVLKWRNSDRIRANMYTDHIITVDEHKKWFQKINQDERSIYKIFEFQELPVGVANASQIDRQNNKCFWAFYLGDTDVPRGSGAVMEFLFLEYIFEEIRIRKLCCEVLAFNTSTVKLHKKFAFREEGYFKQHVFKNEKYEDVISLALFKDDWLTIKSQVEKLCFSKN